MSEKLFKIIYTSINYDKTYVFEIGKLCPFNNKLIVDMPLYVTERHVLYNDSTYMIPGLRDGFDISKVYAKNDK